MIKDDCKRRDWGFTLNNYTSDDEALVLLMAEKSQFIVVGKERGEENGTPHYQGYVYFSNARSFKSMKKLLPRAHYFVPNGTPDQNATYCRKQKEGFGDGMLIEKGELPMQGKRTDLTDMVNDCKKGITDKQLIEKHTEVYAKYPRFVEKVKLVYERKRDPNDPPQVKCYWGNPGVGKTRTAYEEFKGECYKHDPTKGSWWDGYDGDENVIIDEADKGYIKLSELLSILDRYPVKVPVKGGFRQFVASKIILTANSHPEEWYPNCSDAATKGLLRRIHEIRLIGEDPRKEINFDDSDDLIS